MNPDTNLPPAVDPAAAPMPEQTANPVAMPEQPGPTAVEPVNVPMPAEAVSTPQQPAAVPEPPITPAFPMPAPMIDPSLSQPMMNPSAPQMPIVQPKKSKKKFFILGAVALMVIVLGVVGVLFIKKASLIGSLTQDSYQGVNFKRPSSWEKDSSAASIVFYHPKQSTGKGSDGKSTYALKMGVQADEGVFSSSPDTMKASYKAQLQAAIDKSVSTASTDILPSKSVVGCDDAPTYKDVPKKIDVANTFLAISYSFTCKAPSASGSQFFYFSVVDVVPNNKNTEYIIQLGAASEATYTKNLTKINEILSSVSF